MKVAMARIRSVHPGQWTAGDFLECCPLARLLGLALRNVADDNGIFRWKPKTIKAECLPADNCDIDQLLLELVTNEQVKRYSADGKEYGIIVDFTQWQRPKKPKYLHPVPDWFSTGTEPVPNEEDTEPEIPPQREEVGGRREEVKESIQTPAKPQACSSDDFQRFKKAFPRRDGSNPWQPAEKKFNALVKTGVDPEVMVNAALALAREESARGNIGTKFIPQAITWLNQQRFQDYAVGSFDDRSELDWDQVLTSYKKFGHWSPQAGPDLTSPACRAPKEMLEKYGLELRRMQ
jgi:hypothetical protein